METIDVFMKGDALTPQKFWEYALKTETEHVRFYNKLGFTFSVKHTKEYIRLTDNDKNRVNFTYINGILQV